LYGQNFDCPFKKFGKIMKNSAIDSFSQAECKYERIETFPRAVLAGKNP
jgi:hypothetical protein